jgi:hypothetical protein
MSGSALGSATTPASSRRASTSGEEPATVNDFTYTFAVPCQTTVSTTIGSTCSVNTTADAIAPGTVQESVRSIWQLGQVKLFDGGSDGIASTVGNTLFEIQGVFAP